MTNDLPTVASDSGPTRRHRAHQGRWRESMGWPPGPPSDARARERYPLLTNYLAPENGRQTAEAAGINLMSKEAVKYTRERLDVLQRIEGVAETDRLWRNLLSSQPLAFSIAGHLRAHPEAAVRVFSELIGREVVGLASLSAPAHVDHELRGIEAEWFPPRELHTGDRSGFDIAALLALRDGEHLLLTIEVKYVDSFSPAKLDVERYARQLDATGVDRETAVHLVTSGGSQFLRSVLLTDSVRRNGIDGAFTPKIDDAVAVVLGRDDDDSARRVVAQFKDVTLPVKAAYWSHSELLDAADRVSFLAPWARALRRRYVIPRES